MKIKLGELRQIVKSIIKEQWIANTNKSIPGSMNDIKFKYIKNGLKNVGYTSSEDEYEGKMVSIGFGYSRKSRPENVTPNYSFSVNSAYDEMPLMFNVSVGRNPELHEEIIKFWRDLGYKNFKYEYQFLIDNQTKFLADVKTFFKKFPPEKKGGKEYIPTDEDKMNAYKSYLNSK